MAVEIRELTIKTEVRTQSAERSAGLSAYEMKVLKKQIVEECKRSFQQQRAKSFFDR